MVVEDSGSCVRKDVEVQLLLPALKKKAADFGLLPFFVKASRDFQFPAAGTAC